MDTLRSIPPAKRAALRENVIALIPRLVYATPNNTLSTFRDSFNVTLRAVASKVKKMKHLGRKSKGTGGGAAAGAGGGADSV